MPSSVDSYQGDLMRVDLLQCLAVTDRDEPVAGAMYNIGMTFYIPDPEISAQVIPKHDPQR